MIAKTFIHQIECLAHGPVQIRFALVVESADGNEVSRKWHRTVLAPDMSPAEVSEILAANNNSIAEMGFPKIDENSIDWQRLKTVADAAWTVPVRTKFAEVKSAYLAQMEEKRIAESKPE